MGDSRRIDQMLPIFAYGDAIGNHVRALAGIVRRRGHESAVFAQNRHVRLAEASSDFIEYWRADDPRNICLFHFSMSHPLTEYFRSIKARKVLVYHSITPPEFFHGVNHRIERGCREGREQLATLAGAVELALCDSEFNRRELDGLGFARTGVLPILVDFASLSGEPKRHLLARYRDGNVNVLHVGRLAPNKRIEDVVKAFYFYRKINPASRLLLTGTDLNTENYARALRGLAADLGLTDAVHFLGHVDHADLCTYYRLADLYLCMSEHEGFCVPLVEAMHFGVPILAFNATAVPDTLGEAGLVFDEKRFEEVAELMHAVVSDASLREALVAAGRRRLPFFSVESIEGILARELQI